MSGDQPDVVVRSHAERYAASLAPERARQYVRMASTPNVNE